MIDQFLQNFAKNTSWDVVVAGAANYLIGEYSKSQEHQKAVNQPASFENCFVDETTDQIYFSPSPKKYTMPEKYVITIENTEQSIKISNQPKSRKIDNTDSAAKEKREISVSTVWSQTYNINYSEAKTNVSGNTISYKIQGNIGYESIFNIGGHSDTNIKEDIESELKKVWSISGKRDQIYTEKLVIEIPPKTELRLMIYEKYVYQHGIIRVNFESGKIVEIPFQVAIDVLFDSKTETTS